MEGTIEPKTITDAISFDVGWGEWLEKLSLCEPRQANLCVRAFRHDKF